eukprot:symbB.v1.2.020468.t1/scaffold1729.1/size181395/5
MPTVAMPAIPPSLRGTLSGLAGPLAALEVAVAAPHLEDSEGGGGATVAVIFIVLLAAVGVGGFFWMQRRERMIQAYAEEEARMRSSIPEMQALRIWLHTDSSSTVQQLLVNDLCLSPWPEMGQQAATFAPCVARVKSDNGHDDPQQLTASLQKVEKLLLDTETLQRECDAHFQRAGLDAHGTMRRVELRRLLWTFAHSLGSTELTWEAIEAFAITGTLEANVPVVTREEFFRCVTKTVHLVGRELRRKLQEVENRLRPLPRRPPERAQEQSGPTPKTPGRHSSPWAAMAELSGSEGESPISSPRPSNGSEAIQEPEHAQDAIFRPAPCAERSESRLQEKQSPPLAAPRPQQAPSAAETEADTLFRPAPEPQAQMAQQSDQYA